MFAPGSSWACAPFPRCVAVSLNEFFLESGDVVGVGFLKMGCGEGGNREKLGEAIKGFCSVAIPTLPSTILRAARISSSANASWMDFMSRLRVCVGVCLAPWAEGGGELESSHSFSHSPSQAWRIRRVMAVEMDSPFWPLFPPRVLMLENNNRSKKKKRFLCNALPRWLLRSWRRRARYALAARLRRIEGVRVPWGMWWLGCALRTTPPAPTTPCW